MKPHLRGMFQTSMTQTKSEHTHVLAGQVLKPHQKKKETSVTAVDSVAMESPTPTMLTSSEAWDREQSAAFAPHTTAPKALLAAAVPHNGRQLPLQILRGRGSLTPLPLVPTGMCPPGIKTHTDATIA
jgi:hypothetical protein